MTAPLTDARLDYLVERAGFCRSGCEASEATGEMVAEIRRLRAAQSSLAAAFDGVCGERDQRARETEDTAEKLRAATRTLVRVAGIRDRALALLERGVDDEPCDVDQHGLCQAHWLSPAPCRNAEARRLLGLDAADGAA